jgi:FAD/FMN-containing dehydrogenase
VNRPDARNAWGGWQATHGQPIPRAARQPAANGFLLVMLLLVWFSPPSLVAWLVGQAVILLQRRWHWWRFTLASLAAIGVVLAVTGPEQALRRQDHHPAAPGLPRWGAGPQGLLRGLQGHRPHPRAGAGRRLPARPPRRTGRMLAADILTASTTPGPDPAFTRRMLARNRRLFDQARAVGGTRYLISSIEFRREDWIAHYGVLWPRFARLRQRYDPDGILAVGLGIF